MEIKPFCEVWSESIKKIEKKHDHLMIEVEDVNLADICTWLRDNYHGILLDAFSAGDQGQSGSYLVQYTFELEQGAELVTVYTKINAQKPAYPAVSTTLHAADWYEREIYEMFGILPKGHPMLGGFVFHTSDVEPPFPLRKKTGDTVLPQKELVSKTSGTIVKGEGVFDMPLGPVYSGIAEAAHFNLSSIGEEILWVRPRFFYKHRGFEKAAEDLKPEQAVLLAERIAGTTSVSESLAFCQAVEELASIEVPPRALYLRTIFAELERVYNHVGNIAEICESTSLGVGTAQGFILKERLLRLNALLTGHRYLMGTNCIGGIRVDLGKQKIETLQKTLIEFNKEYKKLIKMLLSTDSFLDRLEGIGVLSPDMASGLSATGPVGRASKVDKDFRRDHPYAVYGKVEFDVPVVADGDCLARMRVRHAEIEQSLLIIEQLINMLPEGPLVNNSQVTLTTGDGAYGFCEGPRGNTLHWLSIGEKGLIWRWRVRTPSLVNWHTYSLATEGSAFQDFPIILASFGLSHAECDR